MLQCWSMMAERDGYLAKAQENLRSATSDLAQGRYNSGARSAYYACFHAAIAALRHAGMALPAADRVWGHDRVHALFVGHLIQRQKHYPASLRRTLPDLLTFRHKADYREHSVSQREAQQAVRQAQAFVQAVLGHVAPGGQAG